MEQEIHEIANRLGAKLNEGNLALLNQVAEKWPCDSYAFNDFCDELETQTRRKEGQARIKYRLQACLSFPYLSIIMIAKPALSHGGGNHYKGKNYKELFDSIDAGKPLIPALTRYLKIKGTHFIEEKHIRVTIRNSLFISDNLLNQIAKNVPIDHFPKNSQELDNIDKIINATFLRVHSAGLLKTRAERDNLRSTCLRIFNAKSHEMFMQKQQEQPIDTLRDTALWLYENIVPTLIHNDSKAKPTNEAYIEKVKMIALRELYNILAEQRLSGLMDLNFQMHKNRALITRALDQYDADHVKNLVQEWVVRYPGADSLTLPILKNFMIVPLATREQLNEEYRNLNHCVDTYAASCITGKSHVYSLRDETGNSLSTFEINENKELAQHFGFGNTTPSEDQQNFVRAYIKAIQNGTIKEHENYSEWRERASQFTDEEIHGYEGVIPYERARIFFKAAVENYALTRRAINSLLERNFIPSPV